MLIIFLAFLVLYLCISMLLFLFYGAVLSFFSFIDKVFIINSFFFLFGWNQKVISSATTIGRGTTSARKLTRVGAKKGKQ